MFQPDYVSTRRQPLSYASTLHTDEDLLAAVSQDDDPKAFEQLFRRHYDELARYAFAILRCRQHTEEVVSDVFLKIWNQRKQLNIQGKLKGYLLISVRNLAIDCLRRRRHRRCTDDIELTHVAQQLGESSVHEWLVGNELHQRIEAAIERLPRQGRIIFRLSRDGGMKYREIAEHMGLSIKTVETHMMRSLLFLRRELGDYISDYSGIARG